MPGPTTRESVKRPLATVLTFATTRHPEPAWRWIVTVVPARPGRTVPQKPVSSAGTCRRTVGDTETAIASLAMSSATSRKRLDWTGFTFGVTVPLRGVICVTVFQLPDRSSCCSSTDGTPRAVPLRAVELPYVTGVAGAPSARTPTWNQVDRSPSAARTWEPVACACPFEPVATTLCTRPEEEATVWTSASLPGAFRPRPSFRAVYRNGPQSWYGEMESYGSGTETR